MFSPQQIHMTQFPPVVSYFVVHICVSIAYSNPVTLCISHSWHVFHSLMRSLNCIPRCEMNCGTRGAGQRTINRLLAFQSKHTSAQEKEKYQNRIECNVVIVRLVHSHIHTTDSRARSYLSSLQFPLLSPLWIQIKKKLLSAAACTANKKTVENSQI